MKKIKFIICMIIIGISCIGCAVGVELTKEIAKAAGHNKPIFTGLAKEKHKPSSKTELGAIIERHTFGSNIVTLNKVIIKGEQGYVLVAYDQYGKIINDLFYKKSNPEDMEKYQKFLQMPVLEKRRFIHETFIQYAKVDLGHISPRPGDTYETVIAEFGKPDDTIPLYYEEGIAVSEMLIYYESPKKFLAVGIARGKVVRTQEFALSEGQGLKDALASAGITPATIPEPTPAPAKPSPLGTIPTTGFMPR